MGRKRTAGLLLRNGIWHIDKQYRGRRLCESTGASGLAEAEEYLTRKLEGLRQADVYGVRPKRTFRQAATKYLNEHGHKRSIQEEARQLKYLDPLMGDWALEAVHMGTLAAVIAAGRKRGLKSRSINLTLCVVRQIIHLAAREWIDEHHLAWLASAPKIRMLPVNDARAPYPLSWDEQARLFQELPPHLARMALFKVNTGCREQEVCGLQWAWEVPVPELGTTVFRIPRHRVKNGEERLVVLNRVARSVVEAVRGAHPEYVFVYQGHPVTVMNNSGWQSARVRAGLPQVRVHDLKHTFGRRLRAAGVGFEDRQDLLGHRSGRITTHYSAPEIGSLLAAAERACTQDSRKSPAPLLQVVRAGGG